MAAAYCVHGTSLTQTCNSCGTTAATNLVTLQRDLAQARAEAARMKAALERLCRCMERDPDDGVCLAHHVLNGGTP